MKINIVSFISRVAGAKAALKAPVRSRASRTYSSVSEIHPTSIRVSSSPCPKNDSLALRVEEGQQNLDAPKSVERPIHPRRLEQFVSNLSTTLGVLPLAVGGFSVKHKKSENRSFLAPWTDICKLGLTNYR